MRCENCGRRLPCSPCDARAAETVTFDFELPTGAPIIVWFAGSPDEQLQLLNRLRAEWPFALDEIEPTEPGDSWGACLARHRSLLGLAVTAEFEVSSVRITKLPELFVSILLENLAR